jgi:cytochrome P450
MTNPTERFDAAFRKYGDIYSAKNMVFGPEVVIANPDVVKQVFTGDPELFPSGEVNEPLAPLAGTTSMVILDGERHLRMRRLMLPPFHGERMQLYGQTIIDITGRIIDEWPKGSPFALHSSMQRITLEVILRAVFGLVEGAGMSALRDDLARLLELGTSPIGMVFMLPALQRDLGPLTPWAEFKRVRDRADEMIYAQIGRGRAAARDAGQARTDILTMLIQTVEENGGAMTDAELRDQLMTLLAAGHETTTTGLCWVFAELLSHPEALDRTLRELKEVTGGGPPGPEHIERLTYLDAVVKEALRLRPVIPIVGRRLKVPMRIGDYDIPAGMLVAPCAYLAQRHPDYWREPTSFIPERFLGHKPDPYAWFPFGGGVRRCPGKAFALYEMKAVVATILSRVRLRLVQPPPIKVVLRSFVFAPEGGTRVVRV